MQYEVVWCGERKVFSAGALPPLLCGVIGWCMSGRAGCSVEFEPFL